MGAIVAGLLPLAVAYIAWRRNQVPGHAVIVPGVVIEEVRRRSTTPPRSWSYAPVLSYQDPDTGREQVLHPGGYSNLRYEVGRRLDIWVDPATGEARRVPERPVLEVLIPGAIGLALIVGGIITTVR